MEKLSSIDRVVGRIPEARKERILQEAGERFNNQAFEALKTKEREKTSEELQIVDLVNRVTNEIRQKYGLESFDIPPENIHVIAEEKWPMEKSIGIFSISKQAVATREKMSKLGFAATVFHELIHFKSYGAAQITAGEKLKLDSTYRLGLSARTRDGEKLYFDNLNEAVTEELTKRFVKSLSTQPLFAAAIKQTREVMVKNSHVTADSGRPLFDDDTYYAEVQGRKSWRESVGRLFGKGANIATERFSYTLARQVLNVLIDKLFERNLEKFQDREEVFEVFAKGMMTGNILPVGRLVEETFGKGTFRKIGELDEDIQAQEAFIGSL